MFTEDQRKSIITALAISDARQLEKYLERKAKLLSELQSLEVAIQRKTTDLSNLYNSYENI